MYRVETPPFNKAKEKQMGSDCRALGGFGLRAYQKGAGDLRALSPAREILKLRHGARQQFTKLDISLLPSAGKIGLPRIQGICGILWAMYINAQQVPSPPPSPILLGPRQTSRRRTVLLMLQSLAQSAISRSRRRTCRRRTVLLRHQSARSEQ